MTVISQTPHIIIKCFHTYDENTYSFKQPTTPYKEFSPEKTGITGAGITSYSWDNSVGSEPGNFQFTVKEENLPNKDNPVPVALGKSKLFSDNARPLDVIKIYEGKELVFVGVINSISFNASTYGTNRIVTISGQSIDCLFSMYTISFDATAMNFSDTIANTESERKKLADKLSEVDSQGNGASVKECLKLMFDYYKELANKIAKVSAVTIGEILAWAYSGKSLSSFDLSGVLEIDSSLKFRYPMVVPAIPESTVTFLDWIQNCLPSNCYEFFTYVTNGKLKIMVREVPFGKNEFRDLRTENIPSSILTSYTFTRTNANVYTAFMPYLAGSNMGPEFYAKIAAKSNGYGEAREKDMAKLYGFKVLNTSFVGFSMPKDKATGQDDDSAKSGIESGMKEMGKKMKEWYGNLEKMYTGTIEIANPFVDGSWKKITPSGPNIRSDISKRPVVGICITLGKYKFYVNAEKSSWTYGAGSTITYEIERGGEYTMATGEFKEMKGFAAYMTERTEFGD